jgi:hypothetical protein
MSNIVEPQITETKPSAFGDFIKNNPIDYRIQLPVFQQDNGEPYVFLKDFSFINSTTDGSIGSNMVNYKKDQVVYPFPSSPNVRMMPNPAFTKAINDGVLVPQKTAQQQALMQAVSDVDVLTAEDKFYEKLGIKYHNTHMFGVASRMKGRFYLAVVLIASYFVYKKLKK